MQQGASGICTVFVTAGIAPASRTGNSSLSQIQEAESAAKAQSKGNLVTLFHSPDHFLVQLFLCCSDLGCRTFTSSGKAFFKLFFFPNNPTSNGWVNARLGGSCHSDGQIQLLPINVSKSPQEPPWESCSPSEKSGKHLSEQFQGKQPALRTFSFFSMLNPCQLDNRSKLWDLV